MSQGIDYGLGKTNIDTEKNIRYGVIPINACVQAWSEESQPYYFPACPFCGEDIGQATIDKIYSGEKKKCKSCKKLLSEIDDFQDQEPSSWYIDDGEYVAESTDIDIFIMKSPFYSLCKFCSPCAPGAGYLLDNCNDGVKAYCFNHDFFEEGKAPYRVFRVSDNSEVFPEKE